MRYQDNKLVVSQELQTQIKILGGFVGAFWLLEVVDWLFFRGALNGYGVLPRTLTGLRGIMYSPFLHANFAHLIANTIPFVVLGWFVMVRRTKDFWLVTAVTMLVSGVGVWLLGPSRTMHIGASGLIFGYFGFLVLRGYFERSANAIAWSIAVVLLYGGMIWGVLPQAPGISWQSHLFGFIGGGIAAYWLANREPEVMIRVLDSE